MTIRVLVADDERLIRRGLRMLLDAEPDIDVVAEAADGIEALDAVARFRPDVVLMDVRMPRLDGLEATRRILERGDGAPRVVVLTTFDLDEYVYAALHAGASGFLLKDAPEDQLLAAIRLARDGGSLFSPSATRRLVAAFARRPDPAELAGLDELTPRETEVLRLVATGSTNREIATALGMSDHTAKTHVAHILDKLGARDRMGAALRAWEAGLAGAEPPEPT